MYALHVVLEMRYNTIFSPTGTNVDDVDGIHICFLSIQLMDNY